MGCGASKTTTKIKSATDPGAPPAVAAPPAAKQAPAAEESGGQSTTAEIGADRQGSTALEEIRRKIAASLNEEERATGMHAAVAGTGRDAAQFARVRGEDSEASAVFDSIDVNHDGVVTLQELLMTVAPLLVGDTDDVEVEEAMAKEEAAQDSLEYLFRLCNTQGDGIDLVDFRKVYRVLQCGVENTDAELEESFAAIDAEQFRTLTEGIAGALSRVRSNAAIGAGAAATAESVGEGDAAEAAVAAEDGGAAAEERPAPDAAATDEDEETAGAEGEQILPGEAE